MASVRCPECDYKQKIPADYERATIKCSECGAKIWLDDDEEEDRPRKKRKQEEDYPSIEKKKKKKKKSKNALSPILTKLANVDTSVKIIVGISILTLLMACMHPRLYLVPVIYGAGLILLGSVIFLIVVINDGAGELLLCLFIPFYSLYYLITHWDETKASLYLQIYGSIVCMSFLCAVPVHLIIFAIRDAIMGAR